MVWLTQQKNEQKYFIYGLKSIKNVFSEYNESKKKCDSSAKTCIGYGSSIIASASNFHGAASQWSDEERALYVDSLSNNFLVFIEIRSERERGFLYPAECIAGKLSIDRESKCIELGKRATDGSLFLI